MPLPSIVQARRRFGASWVKGMLLAVRIPLISDHDRFVARLFPVQVNEAAARELGAWARRQQNQRDVLKSGALAPKRSCFCCSYALILRVCVLRR
jgi:hypothetical protein